MARSIAAAATAALMLSGCSYEQAGNGDFVKFGVIPFAVTVAAVQPKADAHCARYGRQAVLADDFGMRMTFNCIDPPRPAPTFVP
jgi:hypothetical protein